MTKKKNTKGNKAITKSRGRKSYWDVKIRPRLKEISHWCRKGYTDKLICDALGISNATFCKYKLEKLELVEVLKVNKEIADLTVVNSLYKRANGYEYEETTIEEKKDKDGNVITTKQKTIKKQKSPDTTAQIFWLKNRCNEWTDRTTISHEGEVNNTGTIEHKHEISIEESTDRVAEVLGILIKSGLVAGKLIEDSKREPKLIEGSHT